MLATRYIVVFVGCLPSWPCRWLGAEALPLPGNSKTVLYPLSLAWEKIKIWNTKTHCFPTIVTLNRLGGWRGIGPAFQPTRWLLENWSNVIHWPATPYFSIGLFKYQSLGKVSLPEVIRYPKLGPACSTGWWEQLHSSLMFLLSLYCFPSKVSWLPHSAVS